VWVGEKDDPAWMRGGSYLVTRRIRMMLEIWDRSTLADQELTIGRNKQEGAPLGAAKEHDTVDLTAKDNGELAIPTNAHIRLAAPSQNKGIRLLRRGFSFTDGIDPVTNQLDSGLFFIAYQRDPRTGFIRVQEHLATDALNEYIRHDSTGTFACPPGVGSSGFVGETLFT
jgi:deferrochelatase/peroxidase EfeB